MRVIEQKKKIALLFASGSLLSIKGNRSIFFIDSESDVPHWLSELPEAQLIADISPFFLQGEQSIFTTQSVQKIIELLIKNRDTYDGFVVLVRAENMVFVASACEYLLQNYGKSIIFAGSRYSPEALVQQNIDEIIKAGGLGLRSNLINALQVATNPDFKSTAIMFGSKLIKPTKAVISNFHSVNLFRSFDETYLGKVDFGISLYKQPAKNEQPILTTKISEHCLIIGPSPLGTTQMIDQLNSKNLYTTLLLHVQPNERIAATRIAELMKKFHRIVLFNQHYVLEHSGVVVLTRMSWAAAVAKVLWADAAASSNDEFIKFVQEEID